MKLRRYNYKFGTLKGFVLAEHLEEAKDKIKTLPFCLDGKVPKACMIWMEEY